MKNTHNVRGVSFSGHRHRKTGTDPLVGIRALIDRGYRAFGADHHWDLHDASWPGGTHRAPAGSNRD